ncbi:hypothetical protein AWB78_05801 [Caballeronia calidae]|uniref:Uncharacterized protein n=2 Tax=Caballeronia calidae TaxID=1777139 RepID=A0A158DY74_9BURK|nr:hypothetical protein AWB78_05801 [Caballeronia calidae]
MNARDYLHVLESLTRKAGSGRLENSLIIAIADLADQIALSLDLPPIERDRLLMARATALGGRPDLAIAKIETILRRIAGL